MNVTGNEQTERFIKNFRPCEDARNALRSGDYTTPQAAWDAWDDGLQMLWVIRRLDAMTNRQSVTISCRVIREIGEGVVWKLLTDERSRTAVESAEAWLRDEVTIEQVRSAANAAAADAAAAEAAYVAYVAYAAAADAAYAAAADAAYAAAADVAYAAAADADIGDVAYAAAADAARKQIADIVREVIPVCPYTGS